MIALAAVIFTATGVLCARIPSARVDVRLVGATAAVLGDVTWAATALAAPLAAGVALNAGGAEWAFVATATTGFAVAAWMLLPKRPAYA